MSRFFSLRKVMALFLVLLTGAGISCDEAPVTAPETSDNEEYTLTLEVYRTGADLLGLCEEESGAAGIVGRGGFLMLRESGSDRFVAVATGVANNLTVVDFTDLEIIIAGTGLSFSDPGIIRYRTMDDLSWTTWDHPARGGITDLFSRAAVTSVGEIMTYDDSFDWSVHFEDLAGPGFSGVSTDIATVYAVGSSGRIFRNEIPRDYNSWVEETPASGPDFKTVYQSGSAEGLVFAAGGTEVWRRTDGTWEILLDDAGGELFAISRRVLDHQTFWVAGANGTILEVNNPTWSEISVDPDVTFRDISSYGRLACGDNGVIYSKDVTGSWTDLGYSNNNPWNDIHGLSPDEIYAANGDTLMRWDGIDWEPLGTNFNEIHSLHAVSSSEVWVLSRSADGFDNFIQFWNGSMFNLSHHTSMDPFNSVWSDAAGDTVMVAANNGYVFRNSGTSWEWLTADSSRRNLYDLDGTSAHDIYAVGQAGLIVHFDGSSWTDMSTGEKDTLRAIDGTVAVGDNGVVFRRSGSSWKAEDSGTTADLHSVCYLGEDNVWAAGEGSQVIHNDGKGWQVYQRPLLTVDFNAVWGDVTTPKDIWFGGENGFLLKLKP